MLFIYHLSMLLIYIYLSINLVYRIRIRIILGFLDPDPEHRLIDMYLETRDPYFYDTDPRIRINIKTIRIRGSGLISKQCGSETLNICIVTAIYLVIFKLVVSSNL